MVCNLSAGLRLVDAAVNDFCPPLVPCPPRCGQARERGEQCTTSMCQRGADVPDREVKREVGHKLDIWRICATGFMANKPEEIHSGR